MKVATMAIQTGLIRLVSKKVAYRYLVDRLSELPGVPAKAGQLLAMKTGVHFDSTSSRALQDDEVLSILRSETPDLVADLDSFDNRPQIASLSQVHQGSLKDGRRVAIKVQIPHLQSELEEQVQACFSSFEKYGPVRELGWTISSFKEYFMGSLQDELRYQLEAARQIKFRDFFLSSSQVQIPRVFLEYSSEKVITQEYIECDKLKDLASCSECDRSFIAEELVRFFLTSVFKFHCVHGDLHPGNWGFDPRKRTLVFYDFGSVVEVQPTHAIALAKLFSHSPNISTLDVIDAFNQMGFDIIKLQHLADVLPKIVSLLKEPFQSTGPWSPNQWNLSERIGSLLRSRKWLFRLAGPPWFLALMRSFQGVLHALKCLDVDLNMRPLYQEIFYDQRNITSDPNDFASDLSTSKSCTETNRKVLSKNLKVEILDGSEQVVYLEFPARTAEQLDSLIPSEISKKIESEGICIKQIVAKVVRSDFSPQTLFLAQVLRRTYRVWLE
jgi:predicted unusual protein kinase regulating ubiquinone biosynthesis (AarF/ABC1/UbiB family)